MVEGSPQAARLDLGVVVGESPGVIELVELNMGVF